MNSRLKKSFLYMFIIIACVPVKAQVAVTNNGDGSAFALVGEAVAEICVSKADGPTVRKVAELLAADIFRVTDCQPKVLTTEKPKGKNVIVLGTTGNNAFIRQMADKGMMDLADVNNGWEQYVMKVIEKPAKGIDQALVIAGSDRRGVAYGTFSLSEAIGVSPWYWWADVPIKKRSQLYIKADYVSQQPTVKYRGFFINDEDWGLKPWATDNFEKELGDIGPMTYAKVCELLLRLKGNMLAPAMHTCTGAFYSHPESKLVADTFGIIITTSHCEPLLLNNAAPTEWDQQRDGDWNYKTNGENIRRKWENRLAEAAQYENIYTVAMRGLHDEGLRGCLPMKERVPLIEQVIRDQRDILARHIPSPNGETSADASHVPQIFVPYKETMDIYENGLQVPDDITLVWVDDNYGYMKRVSNPDEQRRGGGAGVYYHLSYLGTPHDYLWLNTTPPVLMYEELKKAYDTGANRYWLLNVGDIKPMELGIQTFFDMAWDFSAYNIKDVNSHQSQFLASTFGLKYQRDFQQILDEYYRLAWSRKPEYMGWEWEWSDPAHTGLRDTEFSFDNYNEAQRRIADYRALSDMVEAISSDLSERLRPAFFEMLEYPVKAAYQMNRKFLMAQLNHERAAKGRLSEANWAARQSEVSYDSIQTLNDQYNNMLGGKWKGMMDVPPGFCALYQNKPELSYSTGQGEKPVRLDCDPKREWTENCMILNLADYSVRNAGNNTIGLVNGLGYDWKVLQLGQPTETPEDATKADGARAEYHLPAISADTIDVIIHTIPFFPLYKGRSTAIGVSIDGKEPVVYKNEVEEWSQEWKEQVIRNSNIKTLRFAIDPVAKSHSISFVIGDPGMMIQRVIIDWGGLKNCYIGPAMR